MALIARATTYRESDLQTFRSSERMKHVISRSIATDARHRTGAQPPASPFKLQLSCVMMRLSVLHIGAEVSTIRFKHARRFNEIDMLIWDYNKADPSRTAPTGSSVMLKSRSNSMPMPTELIIHIMTFLDPPDIIRCKRVRLSLP